MIQLSHIKKHYNATPILQNISCTIPSGTTTLIIGKNGVGKSTLLRLIAGVEEVNSGEILLKSDSLAYLGQTSSMYPRLTGLENLLFWQKLYTQSKDTELCLSYLRDVNLYSARNKEVRFYSKGMLQRLHIAMMLLHSPDILLLDEPFSGLDTTSTELLYHIIQNKQKEEKTILWITHSLSLDISYASHILFLEKKKVAFFGTVQEYTQYQK